MTAVTPRIAPTVRRALDDGAAVVALESTVVTHGLPRPRNLELARGLERTVRDAGAVPATVGLVAGELVVGLDDDQLARLAAGGADKASLWNLAALAAAGRDAGTTVATTLHAAHRAGIEVFATGGIGGVHDAPYDESADLAALARTPLVTVCSGPKSILDAAATLERLESAGVPVLGYGSDALAGFLVPTVDLPVAVRVDRPEEVAAVKRRQDALGLSQAVLVAQPVSEGLAPNRLAAWLAEAGADAAARGAHGKDATPARLEALARRSGGASVEVNLRLLHENAALAARVARALAPRGTGVPA
jgi:pseudouridine-5'-phosphate glycosidase